MRQSNYPIQSLILNRYSPRAMSGELLSDEELFSLFEAARWAPSAFNAQPWRFFFAKRETKAWDDLLNLLVPSNRLWAQKGAVLVIITSKTHFDHNGKPAKTHSFDTGAAWEYLALQGFSQGLVVHGMQGFDYERAKELCHLPEKRAVEAMIVIGKAGKAEELSEEMQKREHPSDRLPLHEIMIDMNDRS